MRQLPTIIIQLYHIQGPLQGEVQEFNLSSITLGRHPTCQIHFPPELRQISRQHAEIIREGNRFKLIDHSTNGTFLNGKRIKESYLKSGDVIMLSKNGPKMSFLTKAGEGQNRIDQKIKDSRINPDQIPVREPSMESPQMNECLANKQECPEMQESKAYLTIQYGPTIQSFANLPITIGKHPSCDFRIEKQEITDRHAQIFYSQNDYWIKDLTGHGVIRINGKPISQEEALRLNDEIALSPSGPFFSFLGDGRLAEIEPAVQEDRILSNIEEKEYNEDGGFTQEKRPKGPISFLKKFIK